MAEKEDSSLTRRAGGSSAPLVEAVSLSLQPCAQAAEEAFAGDQSAPKGKVPTSGLDGCGPKTKGEEVSKEEPWRAVDSQLTHLEGEDGDDPGFEEFMVRLRAKYAVNVKKMFADYPGAPWAHTGRPDAEMEDPSGAVDDVVTPTVSARDEEAIVVY